LVLGCSEKIPSNLKDKPNVLLITMDTTRADYIGCYGHPEVETPNLDRLAKEGVQFMRNIAPSGTTHPSHASIMTGYYLARHNVYGNETPLADEITTLAEILLNQGYATLGAVSARWLNSEHSNFGQGFSVFLNCEEDQLSAKVRNQSFLPALETMVDRSFFAWIHYFDPHGPYNPAPPYNIYYSAKDRFDPVPTSDRMNIEFEKIQSGQVDPDEEIRQYQGEITFMDKQIGDLLTWLEQKGILDRTLVVAVADHGESMTEKEIYFCHAGMYNQVLQVPLLMRLPGVLPAGRKVETLSSSVDILPTILELLNVPSSVEEAIDGRSLIPALTDPAFEAHPYVFSEAVGGVIRAIYDSQYKYIKPYPWDWAMPEDHLFKPFEDYAEEVDLKTEEPDRAKRMEEMLETWLKLASEQAFTSEEHDTLDPETEEALKALGYMN
jgi:arylsulfatase A-like enzyme